MSSLVNLDVEIDVKAWLGN